MKTTAFILSFMATAGLVPSIAADSHRPSGKHAPPIELERTVYVAETCPMPPIVQRIGQETAARLFEHIGVRMRFTATLPVQADAAVIMLHIRKRPPRGLPLNVLGAASIAQGQVQRAFVFFDRIIEFYPVDRDTDTGVLLGYAIAHEVGHILRAAPGHSLDGVMKACWKQNDIAPMLQEVMAFNKTDAQRIRAVHAARRAAAAAAMETN
jgi:hypothetical protein